MALPPGITPKTVTLGIASFADGSLANGRATISLAVNVLHTPSNRPIFSSDITKPFVDGLVTFDLLPTDAPGLNRVDWSYTLRVEIQGANVQPEVLHFLLPTAGPDVVDLDGLVTVPSSAGTPIAVDVLTAGDLDPLTAGFVADTDSQTGVALRAAFGPTVNVTPYIHGDNDSAAAYARALATLPSAGGTILFDPKSDGTAHDIKGAQLPIRSGVTVRGVGAAAPLVNTGNLVTSVFAQPAAPVTGFTIDGLWAIGSGIDDTSTGIPRRSRNFPKIGGGTVAYDWLTSSLHDQIAGGFDALIKLQGDLRPEGAVYPAITDVAVRNCKIVGSSSLPVFFQGVRGVVDFSSNTVVSCLDVGFIFNDTIIANDNRIFRSADNGLSLSRANTSVTALRNLVNTAAYAGIQCAGYLSDPGPTKFDVSHNQLFFCGGYGVNLSGAPTDGRVHANLIYGVTRGPSDAPTDNLGFGIRLRGTPDGTDYANPLAVASNVAITENQIHGADNHGVWVQAGSQDVTVARNRLVNIGSATRADGVGAIRTDGTDNVGIKLGGSATDVNNVRVYAYDNEIVDTRATPLTQFAHYASNATPFAVTPTWRKTTGVINQPVQAVTDTDPFSLLAPTGCVRETLPRAKSASLSDTATALVSGTLVVQAIPFYAGEVVSLLRLQSGATALAGATNQWACILDAARNVLAVSADKTTEAWAANTEKTFTLTSTWTCPSTGLYYIGIVVAATTVPSLRGGSVGGVIDARAPIMSGRSTTGLTAPVAVGTQAATVASNGNRFYAGAY